MATLTLVRVAQDLERQERHERLVEMEDVEALALEHLADELAVAVRHRERADRPVRGHAPAVAEADDVALARALRTVGAADDADVVAALDEVLVEVADVRVDAARHREDVRRHEADLHGRSRPRPGRPRDGSKRGGRARPPG